MQLIAESDLQSCFSALSCSLRKLTVGSSTGLVRSDRLADFQPLLNAVSLLPKLSRLCIRSMKQFVDLVQPHTVLTIFSIFASTYTSTMFKTAGD